VRVIGGDTGGPDQGQHDGRRDVSTNRAGTLRYLQELADGQLEVLLRLGHRELDLHTRPEQRLDQVALGGALLDQMRQKSEERGTRVVGLDAGPCVGGDVHDATDEDGFEELLLGGK